MLHRSSQSRFLATVLTLATLFAMVIARRTQADNLAAHIPADAKAAAILNDLKDLEEGLLGFARSSGLSEIGDEGFDGVGVFPEMSAEVEEGFEGIGVVLLELPSDPFLNAKQLDAELMRELVVFWKVKDVEKALTLLGAKRVGRFYEQEGEAFYLPVGNVLVGAVNEETLARFEKSPRRISERWSEEVAKLAATSDVFVWVDVQSAKPLIDKLSAMMTREAIATYLHPQNLEGVTIENPQRMAIQVRWLLDGLVWMMDQTESASLGLSVDSERVTKRFRLTFVEGSTLGKRLESPPPAAADLLAGLPASSFHFAYGCSNDPFFKLFVEAISSWVRLPNNESDVSQQVRDILITQYDAALEKMARQIVGGQSNGMSMTREGAYASLGSLAVADAAAYVSVSKTAQPLGSQLLNEQKLESLPDEDFDGRRVVRFRREPSTDAKGQEKVVEEARDEYWTALSPTRVGHASGNDVGMLKALQDQESRLADDPRLRRILADLPLRPHVVCFIDPFELLGSVEVNGTLLSRTPFAAQMHMAPTASPIGTTLTLEKRAVSFTTVVRSELIKASIGFFSAAVEPGGTVMPNAN
ncbi:hypothetical protein Pan216_07310 [Planctomycetes bacterium Pan216]|uniref:DUF3352 domain-containing protein n=1 Tax=Kolteria novifilia TaxID=2527975 RepID=A0A518AYU5_9BACT|nr:hypothetical protein Pan216_07310 [Planctomycetes bacterium Pan216]